MAFNFDKTFEQYNKPYILADMCNLGYVLKDNKSGELVIKDSKFIRDNKDDISGIIGYTDNGLIVSFVAHDFGPANYYVENIPAEIEMNIYLANTDKTIRENGNIYTNEDITSLNCIYSDLSVVAIPVKDVNDSRCKITASLPIRVNETTIRENILHIRYEGNNDFRPKPMNNKDLDFRFTLPNMGESFTIYFDDRIKNKASEYERE